MRDLTHELEQLGEMLAQLRHKIAVLEQTGRQLAEIGDAQADPPIRRHLDNVATLMAAALARHKSVARMMEEYRPQRPHKVWVHNGIDGAGASGARTWRFGL